MTNVAVMGNQETARETYLKDEEIPLQRNFMNGINTDRENLHIYT